MSLFKKKKLGLCLGSGGVKGMAHLGVMKAFEEENIKFDMICGASIGSIIGGMFAKGYSVTNIQSLLKYSEFLEPQMLIKMKLTGMTVAQALKAVMGDIYFEDLKIPFKSVAVDYMAGEVVVTDSGSVCLAMAASGAILPLFPPVEIDGRQLIDGAYLDGVPADVLKDMGADVIISVNLAGDLITNEHSKPALDAKYPTNKVPLCDRLHQMFEYSDYILNPDLAKYKASNILAMDEMYDIGYDLAREKMPEIKKMLKSKGIKF